MRPLIYIASVLLLTLNPVFATQWIALGDGMYIDTDFVMKDGNYAYAKFKYTNMNKVNKWLKESNSGVVIDKSSLSYFTTDMILDCKNVRYKIPLTMMYDSQGNMFNKYTDNTWEYDIEKDDVKSFCEAVDMLENLK